MAGNKDSGAIDLHYWNFLPESGKIAVKAVQLPMIHSDPMDRFIIATAELNRLLILTSDETIKKYKSAL